MLSLNAQCVRPLSAGKLFQGQQSKALKAVVARGNRSYQKVASKRSLKVRASEVSTEGEADPTAELEAVAAAVEKLRLENEALKGQLDEEDSEVAEEVAEVAEEAVAAASAAPVAAAGEHGPFTENWESFEYPPISTDGRGIHQWDATFIDFDGHLSYRWSQYCEKRNAIDQYEGGLEKFSRGYEYFGFNRSINGITYREYAPAAREAFLIGDFNDWNTGSHRMTKNDFGTYEICLPNNEDGSPAIPHGSRVKIHMMTESGEWLDKIPAWIKMAVQAPGEIPYNGVYYDPPPEETYTFQYPRPKKPKALRIYECHVGMSSPEPKVSSYLEFARDVIPRAAKLGYNAIQLMAVQEHAFYGSFGYHVTNFFAVSSRCGTPDELKYLIDTAHSYGLQVLMDVVHSHASNNELDGINNFDGSDWLFHNGARGYHWMWDSRLFNYGNWETMRFLLSNLRWWLEEYKFDGFRFDGVTSMMYDHHGLQYEFTGNYGEYFGMNTDVECMTYLMLANDMMHTLYPEVQTIAEDVSGMPTLARPVAEGGIGFDYRLQMAISDKWVEIMEEWIDDYSWDMGNITHCLTNRRWGEKCIAYAESHDQALVGSKTIAFWLMDADMYDFMSTVWPTSDRVNRGFALHKMIRLLTMSLGGEGYLTFMGNEFGHPEWIDFPRDDRVDTNGKHIPGNGNSYNLARRRYDLADMDHLRYQFLQNFEEDMNAMEQMATVMASEHQYISKKCNSDKMIVLERGDVVMVFNFHPTQAYSDYRIGCLNPGKYTCVLSSDEGKFMGWDNLKTGGEYFADEWQQDGRPNSFQIYAPPRTCAVYAPAAYKEPLDEFCEETPDAAECLMYDD